VRKRPAPGDFRVQPQYGAGHEWVEPSDEAIRIGSRALERAPGQPLYARVDLLADAGGLRLIELELIEPNLYLAANPAAADTLAAAILADARRS